MKFNKNFIILLIISLCFCPPLLASVPPDSVIIHGNAADTLFEGAILKCTLIKPGAPLNGQTHFNDLYTSKITNRKFLLTLPAIAEWFDVVFLVIDRNGTEHLMNAGNPVEVTYLINKNDKLYLSLRSDGYFDFSGQGSTRLSCQQNIYSLGLLDAGPNNVVNELINNKKFQAAYNTEFEFVKLQLNIKRQILESYKNDLSDEEFNRIWFDAIGNTYSTLFYGLSYVTPYQSSSQKIASKSFLNRLIVGMPLADTSSTALSSSQYTNSILMKEIALYRLGPKGDTTRSESFPGIYGNISKRYSDKLRDKLIFLAFINLAKSNVDMSYLSEALQSMKSGDSKIKLIDWQKSMVTGMPAYPFKLPNEVGKIISLKDFRGKVIVADFWFTGCFGCTEMPKAMEVVYKKFKDNRSVVFLSINLDSQEKWWKFGLKQNIYTIPGSIHLSLFGLGKDHPMLKYYNYNDFPQLLVVDKNGNTFSTYPPDPRKDNGQLLTRMIENILL